MKTNMESVTQYHTKIKDIKLRVPAADAEHGIPDYADIIKQRATSLKMSVNEYIVSLINRDLEEQPNKELQITIPVGLKAARKKQAIDTNDQDYLTRQQKRIAAKEQGYTILPTYNFQEIIVAGKDHVIAADWLNKELQEIGENKAKEILTRMDCEKKFDVIVFSE